MTINDIANKMLGSEYPVMDRDDVFEKAKESGIVIVFGVSDDLLEFRGAINEEIGAYGGTTVYLNQSGIVQNLCEYEDCPYFKKELNAAKHSIKAIWSPADMPATSWRISGTMPFEKFDIMEDEAIYCRGIIFSADSLNQQ